MPFRSTRWPVGARAGGIFDRRKAHRRPIGIREKIQLEAKPVSNVHRKHPLSVAISMALLAAAATSARASAPAESAGAQDAAQQDGPTAPSRDAKKDRSGEELQELVVTGVR